MPRELVVNERSFIPAATRPLARERMRSLVATLIRARRAGSGNPLRTAIGINELPLAAGYAIVHWRNDLDVDRDSRLYFKTLTSKSPLIDAGDPDNVRDREASGEVSFDGSPALGLGAAFFLDGLAISLPSAPCWEPAWIPVDLLSLNDQGEGKPESVHVRGADRPETVDRIHREWLIARNVGVESGPQLWEARETLFSSLRFCEATRKQLEGIDRGSPMLRQVVERLDALNRYFHDWSGIFDADAVGFKVTPESSTTLEQFGAERTFECPDGVRRLFSWHCRMTPGAWRLYFEPDPVMKTAYVGYVGDKPASTMYRT